MVGRQLYPNTIIKSNMSTVDSYLWLVVVGIFFGFVYAFGIGANDVANAFASSVSSNSLTLKQAVIAASIFEFSGAYFLGAQVTHTIRSKIFEVTLYENEPEVIMLGMFTSLGTAMVMLLTATRFELPVSTTHTIVGCVMGFSIAAKGFDSIQWGVARQIFVSWVVSPLVSGLVAFALFACVRTFILCRQEAFQRAYYTFSIVLFFGVAINVFYVLNKSTANLQNVDFKQNVPLTLGVALGSGGAVGLIWFFIVGPICKSRLDTVIRRQQEEIARNDDSVRSGQKRKKIKKKNPKNEVVASGNEPTNGQAESQDESQSDCTKPSMETEEAKPENKTNARKPEREMSLRFGHNSVPNLRKSDSSMNARKPVRSIVDEEEGEQEQIEQSSLESKPDSANSYNESNAQRSIRVLDDEHGLEKRTETQDTNNCLTNARKPKRQIWDDEEIHEDLSSNIAEDDVKTGFSRMAQSFADNTYNQDLKAITLAENQRAAELWEAGEVYDHYTEQLFSYLQVVTACLNSFAHGANDVANAIAPISALVQIYQSGGQVQPDAGVERWILAYGGLGIVLGLLFYGYRVMKTLGYKMTMLSPSRGSCAELAASLFVVTASYLSLPVSSTQSICGAIMGVGCVGGLRNVQWGFFLIVCLGWVFFFVFSCMLSAATFAMFAFTPSLSQQPV